MKLILSLVLGLVTLVSYGQTLANEIGARDLAVPSSWRQLAKLTASDAHGIDGFGFFCVF